MMSKRIGPKMKEGQGEGCSVCGAPEVESGGPRTTYACGGSDYDRRPGTCVCPTAPDSGSYEHVEHPAHYGGDTPYEVIKVMRRRSTSV